MKNCELAMWCGTQESRDVHLSDAGGHCHALRADRAVTTRPYPWQCRAQLKFRRKEFVDLQQICYFGPPDIGDDSADVVAAANGCTKSVRAGARQPADLPQSQSRIETGSN